jgi:predicted RNase H-like HicB family nuclease
LPLPASTIRGTGRILRLELQNEFTAIFERDAHWYIAYCPEIPGANGRGRTKAEARDNLAEAMGLILED